MNLRPYIPTDLTPLLELIKAAFKEHEGVVDPPPSAATKTVELLQIELKGCEAVVVEEVVEEKEGRLVGCVFYEPRAKSLYLGRLSVLPALRGRGIASLLVGHVEREARKRGFDSLSLNVRRSLKNQQAIYCHWGFEVVGYGRHEGYAEPTFLRMKKALLEPANKSNPKTTDC